MSQDENNGEQREKLPEWQRRVILRCSANFPGILNCEQVNAKPEEWTQLTAEVNKEGKLAARANGEQFEALDKNTIRVFIHNSKRLMKTKLIEAIKRCNRTRDQVDEHLRKWKFFEDFAFYRTYLKEVEEKLWKARAMVAKYTRKTSKKGYFLVSNQLPKRASLTTTVSKNGRLFRGSTGPRRAKLVANAKVAPKHGAARKPVRRSQPNVRSETRPISPASLYLNADGSGPSTSSASSSSASNTNADGSGPSTSAASSSAYPRRSVHGSGPSTSSYTNADGTGPSTSTASHPTTFGARRDANGVRITPLFRAGARRDVQPNVVRAAKLVPNAKAAMNAMSRIAATFANAAPPSTSNPAAAASATSSSAASKPSRHTIAVIRSRLRDSTNGYVTGERAAKLGAKNKLVVGKKSLSLKARRRLAASRAAARKVNAAREQARPSTSTTAVVKVSTSTSNPAVARTSTSTPTSAVTRASTSSSTPSVVRASTSAATPFIARSSTSTSTSSVTRASTSTVVTPPTAVAVTPTPKRRLPVATPVGPSTVAVPSTSAAVTPSTAVAVPPTLKRRIAVATPAGPTIVAMPSTSAAAATPPIVNGVVVVRLQKSKSPPGAAGNLLAAAVTDSDLRRLLPIAIVIAEERKMVRAGKTDNRILIEKKFVAKIPDFCTEALRAMIHGVKIRDREYPGIPNTKFTRLHSEKFGSDPTVNWPMQAAYEKFGEPGVWIVLFEGWTTPYEYSEADLGDAGVDTLNAAKVRRDFLIQVGLMGKDMTLVNYWRYGGSKKDSKSLFWDYEDLSYFHSRIHFENGLGPIFYMSVHSGNEKPPNYSYAPQNIMDAAVFNRCLRNPANAHIEEMDKLKKVKLTPSEMVTGCENPAGCVCNRRFAHLYSEFDLINVQTDKKGFMDVSKLTKDSHRISIECSDACGCTDSCPRRHMQRGNKKAMVVFFECPKKGNGLRAAAEFKKGEYLGEYTGILKFPKQGEDQSYEAAVSSLDEKLVICSRTHGNIIRFMSHSCSPNAIFVLTWTRVHETDPLLPRIAVFALQDITMGQEISLCYWTKEDMEGVKDSVECWCKTVNCIGRIPAISSN